MKVLARDNYRVVIHVTAGNFSGLRRSERAIKYAKEAKAEAEDILSQVRRHVDAGDSYTESDDASFCSHCGATWAEQSPVYNGGCCNLDELANPENKAALPEGL